MAIVVLPNTLTNGTTADADEVQGNDNALRDGVNNVEAAQIVDGTIVASKLDDSVSPVTRYPETGGQNFVVDAENWITTTTSIDLNYTVPSFEPYVSGIRLVNAGFARLYTALRDTYIDIDSTGALTFSEVSNGATAPSQTAGTLRLLKVVTDATMVTDVVTLATGVAFPPVVAQEFKRIECNLAFNTGSSEVLGNQEATIIFQGKDNTGKFNLDTGTSGVVFDTSIKVLPGGLDQNIVLTAATPLNLWVIGAADGSQPIAALGSYQAAPFGIGNPIYPSGYDIGRWIGCIMPNAGTVLLPSIQTDDVTIFHENIKNVFLASQDATWHIHSFSPNFALADHVGEVLLKCNVFQDDAVGFANTSVTGSLRPYDQDGAAIVCWARNIFSSVSEAWVPLTETGTANIYHDNVTDGTGTGQQGGRKQPTGAAVYGWRYKHD